jgi:hypothetical protein
MAQQPRRQPSSVYIVLRFPLFSNVLERKIVGGQKAYFHYVIHKIHSTKDAKKMFAL